MGEVRQPLSRKKLVVSANALPEQFDDSPRAATSQDFRTLTERGKRRRAPARLRRPCPGAEMLGRDGGAVRRGRELFGRPTQ
jgi:hypothetical protein